MNKLLAGAIAGLAFLLAACQPPSPAVNDQVAVLETEEQKVSYIMGTTVGSQMKSDAFQLDKLAFVSGLEDALSGVEPKLNDEEAAKVIQAFQESQIAAQQEAKKVVSETNLKEGLAFLEENGVKEGVVRLDSGLQYRVIAEGDGEIPGAEQTVEVHYRGTLLDGTEFDSSYARDKPAQFAVNQVIQGWVEALQLMKVGSKWELFIPPELAYGVGGTGGVIGPNQVLKFDVELLQILASEEASSE